MSYQDFPPSLLVLSPRLTRAGNPSASVVGIDTTPLADGSFVYCLEARSEYQLDKQDSAAPDGLDVLEPLNGPGRWIRRFGPGSAGGTPLARTFYVSPNTNPFPDGSIDNPFPDPAAAFAAIPAPIDTADQATSWAVICTPGLYKLSGPLVFPNRSISLTAINDGQFSFLFGVSVVLVDSTGTTPIGVRIPTWTPLAGGTQLALVTMQGIGGAGIELVPGAAGATVFLALDATSMTAGITKSGTNTMSMAAILSDGTQLGAIVLGASDLLEVELLDSDVTAFTGLTFAQDSFIGTWTPAGGNSFCGNCTITQISTPADTTSVIRLDGCEVNSVSKSAAQGQYIFDSASLRSIISNGINPEGLPVSVADATSSQADFTPFNGGTGDVTFTPGTLTLPNLIFMQPAVAQNLNLPDARSWQIPSAAGRGGRSLWIVNGGAGTINIVPLGADTTSLAAVPAGKVALLTPDVGNWDQVLLV